MRYLPLLVAAAVLPHSAALAAITIGQGPVIGQDHAAPPNVFREEFQDWAHGDLRALDPVGPTSGRYNVGDGFDDSRDLVAFYSRLEGNNLYLRVDLYDLAFGAENANVDLYVAIDCAAGGQEFMPDFTDVRAADRWERCIALYNATNVAGSGYKVYRGADFTEDNGAFLGSYWRSDLDSVEFGITRATLTAAGWDGTSPLKFTVMTTKDGLDIVDGGNDPSNATDVLVDKGRGFDDGVIDGSVLSTATAGRAKWASIAHGNQSVNKNADTRIHIFDPNNAFQTGFIRALDTHEIFRVPINLHLSGSLIAAALWAKVDPAGPSTTEHPLSDGPAFIDRVKLFVDADQQNQPGALIGGVLSEHIMPYFEGEVNRLSIRQFNELMEHVFSLEAGTDVKVMHTPERVIRSQPTGLSPLTGLTFPDILAGGYTATYLDEVTHFHWWFDSANTTWSGAPNGPMDKPAEHKIQKINGVYTFLINDREDQAKFGNHDGGLQMDTRYTLLEKARAADQQQLTLVFDDWEAMAGKSFDPLSGTPAANNNQTQYQNTVRWLANKQWIEVVTLEEILDRATNPANPQYSANWTIDRGERTDLTMQTYEWLKHASEGSYNYWYYNNDSGFAGNEQNFYNLVPVITGPQGDYFARFTAGSIPSRPTNDAQANGYDGPKLPSGKKLGDLNTPGSLLHDAWAAVAAAPQNRARTAAEWLYTTMIYETAWHEEDNGNYANTTFQNPWPSPDTTWDGINTWQLRLINHTRKAVTLAAAAQWVAEVQAGTVPADTQAYAADLDLDGENEYVLSNRNVWAVFERYGGRCTYAFAYDRTIGDAHLVIGAAVANPSAPGEEEYNDAGANRCSAFKEMNAIGGVVLADAPYTATVQDDALVFAWSGSGSSVSKRIELADAAGSLAATYTVNVSGGPLYVRIGAVPNMMDLIFNGQANLTRISTTDTRGVANANGGKVLVRRGANATFNDTPLGAGYLNRGLVLTEQIELQGTATGSFSFEVELVSAATVSGDSWMLH